MKNEDKNKYIYEAILTDKQLNFLNKKRFEIIYLLDYLDAHTEQVMGVMMFIDMV